MKAILRDSTTTALALTVFAVIAAGLLAGTYTLTREPIEAGVRQAKLKLLSGALPPGGFDNDPVDATRALPADPRLGLKKPGTAYLARQGDAPVAIVLEAVAPDGYSGDIRLLVGIRADGTVSGVRVVSHRETPGLGDYIEIARSDWIRGFDGRSLTAPGAEGWRVKKDGGAFDSMAGATITPRAVVKAVRKALEYFEVHRAELLAPGPAARGD